MKTYFSKMVLACVLCTFAFTLGGCNEKAEDKRKQFMNNENPSMTPAQSKNAVQERLKSFSQRNEK